MKSTLSPQVRYTCIYVLSMQEGLYIAVCYDARNALHYCILSGHVYYVVCLYRKASISPCAMMLGMLYMYIYIYVVCLCRKASISPCAMMLGMLYITVF